MNIIDLVEVPEVKEYINTLIEERLQEQHRIFNDVIAEKNKLIASYEVRIVALMAFVLQLKLN